MDARISRFILFIKLATIMEKKNFILQKRNSTPNYPMETAQHGKDAITNFGKPLKTQTKYVDPLLNCLLRNIRFK